MARLASLTFKLTAYHKMFFLMVMSIRLNTIALIAPPPYVWLFVKEKTNTRLWRTLTSKDDLSVYVG